MHFISKVSEIDIAVFQYLTDTVFGTTVMFLLAQVPKTKKNILAISILTTIAYFFLMLFLITRKSLHNFSFYYVCCIHIPSIVLYTVYYKKTASVSFLALFFAFFLLTPRLLIGRLFVFLTSYAPIFIEPSIAKRLGWAFSGPILLFPIIKFIIPHFTELISRSKKERIILLGVLFLAYLMTGVLSYTMQETEQQLTIVLSVLIFIFIFAFIISLIFYSNEMHTSFETQNKLSAYIIQKEGLSLVSEALASYIESTARIRHDHRHFLTLLSMHAKQGDYNKINELLRSQIKELDALPNNPQNNIVVEGILKLYKNRAEQDAISIEYQHVPFYLLPIQEDDLCILLSNCLENAIEACKKLDPNTRKIELFVNQNTETKITSLCIKNPIADVIDFDDSGTPLSKKGVEHGFGTKSIAHIVKKYNGLCNFEAEQGFFTFRAVFFPPV